MKIICIFLFSLIVFKLSFAESQIETIDPQFIFNLKLEDSSSTKELSSSQELLSNSWKKWFAEKLNIDEKVIQVCSSHCEETRQSNPFFINIHVNLNKSLNENQHFYVWSGRIALYQGQLKTPLMIVPISKHEHSIRDLNNEDQKKQLLTLIYKSGQSSLFTLRNHIENREKPREQHLITVTGFKKISDALELIKILEQKGQEINLKSNLSSFNKNEAKFDCFFNGSSQKFSEMFSRIIQMKTFKTYNLINLSVDSSYTIKMI